MEIYLVVVTIPVRFPLSCAQSIIVFNLSFSWHADGSSILRPITLIAVFIPEKSAVAVPINFIG